MPGPLAQPAEDADVEHLADDKGRQRRDVKARRGAERGLEDRIRDRRLRAGRQVQRQRDHQPDEHRGAQTHERQPARAARTVELVDDVGEDERQRERNDAGRKGVAEQHPEPAADEIPGDQRGDEDGRQPDVELLLPIQHPSTTPARFRLSNRSRSREDAVLLACAPMTGPNRVTFTVGDADVGRRLDQVLAARVAGLSRRQARVLLDIGGVFVDGRRVKIAGKAMYEGEVVVAVMGGALARATPKTGRAARGEDERQLPVFTVVFEDDDIVLVDKPSGLLTAPTPESDRNNLADLLGRSARRRARVRRPPDRSRDQRAGRVREDGGREPRAVEPLSRSRSGAGVPGGGGGRISRGREADRSPGGRAAGGHARGDPGTVRRPGDAGGLPAGDRAHAPDSAAHGRARNAGNRRCALRAAVRARAAPNGAARHTAGPRPPPHRRAAVVRQPLARRSGGLDRRSATVSR